MKTKLDEINRNIYDIKNKDEYDFKIKKGLTPEIIEEISKQKNDPDWMREFRLKALEVYNKLEMPTWGPDLSELNMDEIATYVRPKTGLSNSWEDVPEDIKNTFDKLNFSGTFTIYLSRTSPFISRYGVFTSAIFTPNTIRITAFNTFVTNILEIPSSL